MKVDEGRESARQAVSDEMVRQSFGPYELARKAGVDPDTVVDFVNGKRWPQAGTRNKIASALGWKAEAIDQLVRGETPSRADDQETVGGVDQDAGVLLSMPPDALEGLSPADREEVITAAKLSALAKAREIRRRIDG